MGWKAQFEPWPQFVWMIIRHWFWGFKICDGCKMDLRERLYPTPKQQRNPGGIDA